MAQFFNPKEPNEPPIDVSEADAIKFQGGTPEDPFRGIIESGFQAGAGPTASPTVDALGFESEGSDVTGGTTNIRNGVLDTQNAASELGGEINQFDSLTNQALDTVLGATPFGQTEQGQADFKALQDIRAGLGTLSPEEQAQAERAGQQAGLQFDPLIGEAQEQKRKGMPKAVINAGERGGFMSTQFAGAAALGPTEGGDFVGAGGELENVKSVYDRNISNLQSQKKSAILNARAAAEQAIRTGKAADFDIANKLFTQAQQIHNNAITLAQEKVQAISQAQSAQASTARNTFDIISQIPEGQTITLNGKEFTGIATPEGAEDFFSSSNIVSLMKSVPRGETLDITDPNTGKVYTLGGLDDPATVTATDDAGNISIINKATGEIVNTIKGVGKTKTRAPSTTIVLKGQEGAAISEAGRELDAVIGVDGFVDTNVYRKERERFAATGADVRTFDRTYANRLNPNDPTAKALLDQANLEAGEGGGGSPFGDFGNLGTSDIDNV